MATPEILLKVNRIRWQPCRWQAPKGWTFQDRSRLSGRRDRMVEKNREEQQYVTDYIEDCIKVFSDEYQKKGPYTTMAANLYHLPYRHAFRLHDTGRLGDVLDTLYPTPAVCGIPKDEIAGLSCSMNISRAKYYSGFVGPDFARKGKTHLYVPCAAWTSLDDGSYRTLCRRRIAEGERDGEGGRKLKLRYRPSLSVL